MCAVSKMGGGMSEGEMSVQSWARRAAKAVLCMLRATLLLLFFFISLLLGIMVSDVTSILYKGL